MQIINKNEARFVREWELQTSGSRKGFLVLNTIIFSVMLYLFAMAATYVASEFKLKGFEQMLAILAVLIMGMLSALALYYRNQSIYLAIKLKEERQNGSVTKSDV